MIEARQDTGQNPELTVCIVTFKPDRPTVLKTIETLRAALDRLLLGSKVFLVDNSPEPSTYEWLADATAGMNFEILSGHGNVGFGVANNMVLDRTGRYHLVLNPDVAMEPAALAQALEFFASHSDCGLISPQAFNPDGTKQYLCKRYPRLFDLLLRGFAPASIRELFRARLDRYEMRDVIADKVFWEPPIISGCFMLFRGDVFRQLKGFDPRYFIYFEDFDISLRTAKLTRIAYVPTVRIVHGGGNAAQKGMWHIWQFARSAAIFLTTYRLTIY